MTLELFPENNPRLLPSRGSRLSAGIDVRCREILTPGNPHPHPDLYHGDGAYELPAGERCLVLTGLRLAGRLPLGYELQVRPRSGLAWKEGITVLNAPGTIDGDYAKEIGVILINHSKYDFQIRRYDRVAQLVAAATLTHLLTWEGEVAPEAERTGGFGSTGKK